MRNVLVGWAVVLAGLFIGTARAGAAPTSGGRAGHATVEAGVNWSALQPGTPAAVAVRTEIASGFHAQSRTPADENYIKFDVTIDGGDKVAVHDGVYPKGERVNYPALGVLDVYQGVVTVYVPVEVKAGTAPGSLTIKGIVRLQACNDSACFPPEKLPFEVTTTIVAKEEKVDPANAKLFEGFDPVIFTRLGAAESTGGAAPPPSAAGAPATGNTKDIGFDVFGRRFTINADNRMLAMSLAFLVGLIFNLMPCVLPVLPLKAIGFYEVSQHRRAKSFLYGLVFSAGMVATFAILGCLVLLKQRQWGDLFAQGWFVWTLTIVLVAMALSLFGLYSFRLPMGTYTFEPRHDTYSGNFLFGGLTAILSTPCTAPMFPGLLAWGAAQPHKAIGVMVLIMVGVGMASPYLVLSAAPELARKFPRTGPWSEVVKQMLGFMVLAVAAFIAGGRILPGQQFAWAIFVVLLAGSIFLMVRAVKLARSSKAIVIAGIIALLLTSGSLALAISLNRAGPESIQWTAYTPEVTGAARHTGKLVLVEFTANWCSNCKTLELAVFHDPEVARAFQKYNVMPFRADLSREDASGWALLKELNPAGGIPLTAIYAPNSPQPIQLSSVYTVQNLKDALEQASRTAVASTK